MRSSELYEVLDSDEEVAALRQVIAEAMPAFRRGLSRRGGSAPVEVATEGKNFFVNEVHVRKVCEEYLSGRLDEAEVAYVTAAIELCPDFEMASEGVEEAVSLLSDPVANGPLSRDDVETLLRSL